MLTAQQLEARRSGLGGTCISIVAGLNPWKTPLDLYLEKKGLSKEETVINDAIHFGNLLEDVVAQEYARRKGVYVAVQEEMIRHPKHDFMFANIDRWVNNKEYVLECKTAGAFKKSEWGEQEDQVPENYWVQCAWYAAVCDVPKVDIAVLIGGQDFRIYTYERNKELEERLIEIGHNFWYNHVLKDIPPEPINVYDTKKLYPQDAGEILEAPQDIVEKLERLKQLKLEQKEKEKEASELECQIQAFMGSASSLTLDGKTLVTWKNSKPRVGLDTQKLKELYPGVYLECVKESASSRPFVLKI